MFEETTKLLGIHIGQGSGVGGYTLMSRENDGRAGMEQGRDGSSLGF